MGNGGKRKMMLAATVAALAIGVAPAIADARPASSVVAGSVTLGGAGKAAYAKTDSAGSVTLGGERGHQRQRRRREDRGRYGGGDRREHRCRQGKHEQRHPRRP